MGADLLGSVLGEQGSDVGGWARGSRRREPVQSGRVVGGHTGVMVLPIALPIKPMLAKLAREIPGRRPTGRSSRSGTGSDASSPATATSSSSPAARNARSPATSPSCSSRCGRRCPSGASSTARSSSPTGDGHGLDFDALLQRIHPAASRVTPPRRRDAERVRRLRPAGARRRVVARPAVPPTAAPSSPRVGRRRRAGRIGIGLHHAGELRPRRGGRLVLAVRGRRARRHRGQAGRRRRTSPTSGRWSRSSTSAPPTACWPGSACTRTASGVGSMLLGLYDDDGRLNHVGVAAGVHGRVPHPSCSPS